MDVIEHKINNLRNLLHRHNYLYYTLDKPEISDFEFDSLMKELSNLERKHPQFYDDLSPTNRVGGVPIDNFDRIRHKRPMLSLSNTYSQLELEDFDSRVKKKLNIKLVDYICELKYDGVAISLIYENGLFHKAVTRGDGVYGDDVSENIKTIKTIPLKLFGSFPRYLEVRGEVFMNKNDFQRINDRRKIKRENLVKIYNDQINKIHDLSEIDKIKKKFSLEYKKHENYSNPRNFASGSLKLLDSAKVAERNLNCVIYSIHSDNLPFDNHYQNLLEAQKWGFIISKNIGVHHDIIDVMNFINHVEYVRASLSFEIDGVVIKVNNLKYQELLSHTSKSPRWAMSYKFKSPQAITVLNNIKYQIGRTGAITPVAQLESVHLAGSLISRASLHNHDFIKKLDLKIGDYVIIEKGGDVIPKVVSVDVRKRNFKCEDIVFITNCPSCNSLLQKIAGEVNYYCLNHLCLPQRIAQVQHFTSRDAMNIQTLGDKTIALLFKQKIIQDIADLYILDVNKLIDLPGFGEKSKSRKKAQNIIESINVSKKQSFERVLFGLGIRYVGKTVSKKLAQYFQSMSILMNSSVENLLEVSEVGEKIANSIVNYFQDSTNKLMIGRLMQSGLQFSIELRDKYSSKLDNLVFVVSGVFSVRREEIKEIIEDHGGKNSSSISKKTNFLLGGEKIGVKKREKAQILGIPIITESDFREMLN